MKRSNLALKGVHIGNYVLIGPGAKILCNSGVLHVGAGTIVGANAVLLRTTGVEEVWAGVPALSIWNAVRPQIPITHLERS